MENIKHKIYQDIRKLKNLILEKYLTKCYNITIEKELIHKEFIHKELIHKWLTHKQYSKI